MKGHHSRERDRTTNATLVFIALFIAAVVAIIETHRDEIEADDTHHHSH